MTRLSKEAYTSSSYSKKEQEVLFSRSWVLAGVESDFKKTGDYYAFRSGVHPLAVVKGRDGELVAHHNICMHRGATLLDEGYGNAGKTLVCPYHRWVYGLDGALRGAPDMAKCFPDMDRSKLGLKTASIGLYKGFVFVNPDPNADFASWVASVDHNPWPHDLSSRELKEAVPLHYEVKCDWKVFVENAIDGYHLAYLHSETLGGPTPDKNVWERCNENMIWYAADGDDPNKYHRLPGMIRKQVKGAPKVKHASKEGYGGVYLMFPNTLFVPTPFGLSVSWIVPNGVGRCSIFVRNWVGPWQSRDERKYIEGYDKHTGIISSDNWKKHALETGDFQTEDVYICEKVQQGLEAPSYDLGPLSLGAGAEDPIRWFHESIAKYWR